MIADFVSIVPITTPSFFKQKTPRIEDASVLAHGHGTTGLPSRHLSKQGGNFVIVIPACGANSENISVVIKAVVWGKVPFGIMLALSFA